MVLFMQLTLCTKIVLKHLSQRNIQPPEERGYVLDGLKNKCYTIVATEKKKIVLEFFTIGDKPQHFFLSRMAAGVERHNPLGTNFIQKMIDP